MGSRCTLPVVLSRDVWAGGGQDADQADPPNATPSPRQRSQVMMGSIMSRCRIPLALEDSPASAISDGIPLLEDRGFAVRQDPGDAWSAVQCPARDGPDDEDESTPKPWIVRTSA
jgi:hypothetical protein